MIAYHQYGCRTCLYNFLYMGTLFGTKGRAVEFMLAPLTKAGVVTGVVIELILTIAELWNFTEGTFSVTWSLGCTPGKMGV